MHEAVASYGCHPARNLHEPQDDVALDSRRGRASPAFAEVEADGEFKVGKCPTLKKVKLENYFEQIVRRGPNDAGFKNRHRYALTSTPSGARAGRNGPEFRRGRPMSRGARAARACSGHKAFPLLSTTPASMTSQTSCVLVRAPILSLMR